MGPDIPVTAAQIVAMFMQSIFYGLYLVSCWFCGERLLRDVEGSRWKSRSQTNWVFVGLGIFLFLNVSANLAMGLYRLLMAFVYYDGPGGAVGYFTRISDWVNVAKSLTLQTQTLVGDMILIYRCYVVYTRSWKAILLPLALWLGSIGIVIRQNVLTIQLRRQALVTSNEVRPYIIAFWALTIAQNIISTGLIVIRLVQVDRDLDPDRGSKFSSLKVFKTPRRSLHRVIMVVVESGLLMSTMAFITFLTVVGKSTGIYVTSAIAMTTTGIAFNLIIIRTVDKPGTVYGDETTPTFSIAIPTRIGQDNDQAIELGSVLFGVSEVAVQTDVFAEPRGEK